MSDRFFHLALAGRDAVTLDGAEAHHLIHVLRAKPGRAVVLFDGSGWEFRGRVEEVERSTVQVSIVDGAHVDRELPIRLVLGVALPKGERQKWLVEKATELGVAQLVPLVTERGVAQPTSDALKRLERAVIEASKQCGRNRLMEIGEPEKWESFAAAATRQKTGGKGQGAGSLTSADSASLVRVFGHPGGTALSSLAARALRGAREIEVAVGPEGGFTDQEAESAVAAGWLAVDLGKRILRVETAALALVAAVAAAV